MPRKPSKTLPQVDAQRVEFELRTRFNPIRGLSPAVLSRYLDEFDSGYLRGLSLLMAKVEDRCDRLKALVPKRKAAPARLDWDVVTRAEAPEAQAQRQREVLLAFYHSLTATSVVDEDERGDFSLLTRQMMDAIGMRYAVHDIVWQPRPGGISAELRQVPLWYFEHTSPRLRYLASDAQVAGTDLQPGEWLVTRGPGLHLAGTILYMFASMSMKDWVNYNRRYALPGLHGQTSAAKGSTEWDNLVAALKSFGQDWALVTGADAKVNPIDVSARGVLPFPTMVERCERAMAVLWRGSDLSTQSSDPNATGASVQGEETDLLFEDDLALLEGYLARGLTPYVIQYVLGESDIHVELRYTRPSSSDITQQIAVDRFLIEVGAPVAVEDLLERYGRQTPDPDAELARAPAAASPFAPGAALANAALAGDTAAAAGTLDDVRSERLRAAAKEALGKALSADLAPVRARIEAALANSDDAAMVAALQQVAADLPALAGSPEKLASQQVFEETIAAALVNGIAEAAARHPEAKPLPAFLSS
jgi:phage gp29-like protein